MMQTGARHPWANRADDPDRGTRPVWARWNESLERRYTVGVEEELMLLHRPDNSLAHSSDAVLARISPDLQRHTSPETHASVIELATGIHLDAPGAAAELAALRACLARELAAIGLAAACAGTYPLACADEVKVSGAARYGVVAGSMRMLARRPPTMALHVHVGVPDPEDAIRLLNALREVMPVLLALSANSPFYQARDTGFASARTAIFGAFPRTGTARRFVNYGDYVGTVQPLIASGALADPSFLWWDARLQPGLGTVEVRVMDAQSTIADSTPLVALVQSYARLALEDEYPDSHTAPEILAENRFLAARDGLRAHLIDPNRRRLLPVQTPAEALLRRCRPHAAALGCGAELAQIDQLATANGADRQRAQATNSGLANLVQTLAECFT